MQEKTFFFNWLCYKLIWAWEKISMRQEKAVHFIQRELTRMQEYQGEIRV
jgi:hypothetical protein